MKKAKWFFGEFFVVVAGVLVAFVLNGWWMSIKEGQQERDYLKYIHSDLLATIDIVEEAETQQRRTLYAASNLLKASYSHPSPADTLLPSYLLGCMSFAPSAQVSATLASLVATGDMQLITNDSLRLRLSELLTSLEGYEQSNSDMAYLWLVPAIERFADVVNIADLRFQIVDDARLARAGEDSLSGFPRQADLQRPTRIDLRALIATPAFRNNLFKLQIAHVNLFRTHVELLGELTKTRALLESEMTTRGIPVARSN